MSSSGWQPSERLRRLAERRGVKIGSYMPDIRSHDIPLCEAVTAAKDDLAGIAYGRLETYTIDWPSIRRRDPGLADRWCCQGNYAEFNECYPTLRAFQDGLRRNDHVIREMRLVGPKILAEFRRVFLGEQQ